MTCYDINIDDMCTLYTDMTIIARFGLGIPRIEESQDTTDLTL